MERHPDAAGESFISRPSVNALVVMAGYEGFCLKCKTYGPIQGVENFTMSNGRKRVAGTCSQNGCTGRISKIIG